MKSCSVTIVFLIPLVICQVAAANDLLNAGSQAPNLEIAHWVTNGDDTFPEVHEFESGRVYVVEFWATWCSPCIGCMPHLADLQTKYGDSSLQIISISDEPKERVVEFLERPFGDKENEKTYADICGQYCLTTDPDSSVKKDYMNASFMSGIPTAFIVGKSGLIEWIGHPGRMDEALEAVLNDSWDRKGFAESFGRKQGVVRIRTLVSKTFKKKGFDEAIAQLDELRDNLNGVNPSDILPVRFELIIRGKPEMGLEVLPGLLADADHDLWGSYANIVTYARMKKNSAFKPQLVDVLEQHHAAALEKIEDNNDQAYLLHSVAMAQAAVRRFDEAIAFEQRAVDVSSGDLLKHFERTLASLKSKQKAASKKADENKKKVEEK